MIKNPCHVIAYIITNIRAYFLLKKFQKIDVDNQYNFKTIKDVMCFVQWDGFFEIAEKVIEKLEAPCDHEVESSFIDLTGITDKKELRKLRKKIHKSPK